MTYTIQINAYNSIINELSREYSIGSHCIESLLEQRLKEEGISRNTNVRGKILDIWYRDCEQALFELMRELA